MRIAVVLLVACFAGCAVPVQSDNTSDLEARIEELERQQAENNAIVKEVIAIAVESQQSNLDAMADIRSSTKESQDAGVKMVEIFDDRLTRLESLAGLR